MTWQVNATSKRQRRCWDAMVMRTILIPRETGVKKEKCTKPRSCIDSSQVPGYCDSAIKSLTILMDSVFVDVMEDVHVKERCRWDSVPSSSNWLSYLSVLHPCGYLLIDSCRQRTWDALNDSEWFVLEKGILAGLSSTNTSGILWSLTYRAIFFSSSSASSFKPIFPLMQSKICTVTVIKGLWRTFCVFPPVWRALSEIYLQVCFLTSIAALFADQHAKEHYGCLIFLCSHWDDESSLAEARSK